MDLLLCYFESSDDRIKMRRYDSCFLGHDTHSGLMQQFNDATTNLSPNYMYQISTDRSNINLKFYGCEEKEKMNNMYL